MHSTNQNNRLQSDQHYHKTLLGFSFQNLVMKISYKNETKGESRWYALNS